MSELDTAFAVMKREDFLPPSMREFAHEDRALPIGYDQTSSQPRTVRTMLDWLKVRPGDNVLDVGSGSGWTTALLSYLTGPEGRVTAVELIAALKVFGERNCARMGVQNAEFHIAGHAIGWPDGAPYDRILVSASTDALPNVLVDQLADGGRMVIPIGESIWVVDKKDGDLTATEHYGFMFVPLKSH